MSDEKTNVQPAATAETVNEDFLPPSDWDRQNDSDTLILMLPGSFQLIYVYAFFL